MVLKGEFKKFTMVLENFLQKSRIIAFIALQQLFFSIKDFSLLYPLKILSIAPDKIDRKKSTIIAFKVLEKILHNFRNIEHP